MKEITSKRNKTDADHEELARLEFFGSLYMNENGPIIPDYVLLGCIVSSAKKERKGPAAKSGVFVNGHSTLEYEGPRDAEALWDDGRLFEDGGYVGQDMVTIQRNRILRTRPYFRDWSLVTTVQYEDTLISEKTIDGIMHRAGNEIGLCDWRPRFGRFTVEVVEEPETELSKNGRMAVTA